MAGGAHKACVLIVRHLETSDEKFADEDTMNRTLIVVGVYSAHQEVARRNAYEVGRWNGISHRARRPFLDRDHKNRSIVRTIITFMEIADVKRRVIETIDRARRRAGDRRTRADAAAKSYEAFLNGTGVPIVRQVANVLRAQGYPFEVFTPAGGVRLSSERGT